MNAIALQTMLEGMTRQEPGVLETFLRKHPNTFKGPEGNKTYFAVLTHAATGRNREVLTVLARHRVHDIEANEHRYWPDTVNVSKIWTANLKIVLNASKFQTFDQTLANFGAILETYPAWEDGNDLFEFNTREALIMLVKIEDETHFTAIEKLELIRTFIMFCGRTGEGWIHPFSATIRDSVKKWPGMSAWSTSIHSEPAEDILNYKAKISAAEIFALSMAIPIERRLIATGNIRYTRHRIAEVAMALQPLELSANELVEIVSHLHPVYDSMPFHRKWDIVVAVKHREKSTGGR